MVVGSMVSTGQALHTHSQIDNLKDRLNKLEKKQLRKKYKPYCLSVDPNCK